MAPEKVRCHFCRRPLSIPSHVRGEWDTHVVDGETVHAHTVACQRVSARGGIMPRPTTEIRRDAANWSARGLLPRPRLSEVPYTMRELTHRARWVDNVTDYVADAITDPTNPVYIVQLIVWADRVQRMLDPDELGLRLQNHLGAKATLFRDELTDAIAQALGDQSRVYAGRADNFATLFRHAMAAATLSTGDPGSCPDHYVGDPTCPACIATQPPGWADAPPESGESVSPQQGIDSPPQSG